MTNPPSPWDEAVYRELVPQADFIIHHLYGPKLPDTTPAEIISVVGTAGETYKYRLTNSRNHMRELAGKEIPIAVTEFNISSSSKSHPWRFSYVAGMSLCQLMMEMRRPEQNVIMASYWQHIGGHFGSLHIDDQGNGTYNAVWPFLQAFSERTSTNLLQVETLNVPKIEYQASKVGEVSAMGNQFLPSHSLDPVEKLNVYFTALDKLGISGEGKLAHLKFQFKNVSQNSYPVFCTIPVPAQAKGESFSMVAEFEALYTPDPASKGSVALGFGLMDSRGYATTHLATAVTGLEKATQWTRFTCDPLSGGPDTPAQTALLRIEKVSGEFSGTLEIRNLKFHCQGGARVPAFSQLAVEASQENGTVYLTVINRVNAPMKGVRIQLDGITPGNISGTAKELYQSDISTTAQFDAVEKPIPALTSNSFSWDFPPFSATFFKFQTQPVAK